MIFNNFHKNVLKSMDKKIEELLKRAEEAKKERKLNRKPISWQELCQIIDEEKLLHDGIRIDNNCYRTGLCLRRGQIETAIYEIDRTQNEYSVTCAGERRTVGQVLAFKTESEAYWYILDCLRFRKIP